jgi:hypothetical protein
MLSEWSSTFHLCSNSLLKKMFYMYKFCGTLALCFCFHCIFVPIRKSIICPVTLPTNEIYGTVHNAVFSYSVSEGCVMKFVTY